MPQLELSLLFIIFFVGLGIAIDAPFVFDEDFWNLTGSDPYQLEETSALFRNLEGIPPVSSPDDDYIIEVTLSTSKFINKSSGDNCTAELQNNLSGLVVLNQSSLANAQKSFDTEIPPNYSILVSPEDWFAEGNKNYIGGNYQKAVECYHQAVELDEGLKEVWYNKGIALCKLGKYQDAVEAFDRALHIDPLYSNAEKNRNIALKKFASNSGED